MLGFYTLVGSHGLSQFAVHLEDEINKGLYYVNYLLLYEYNWLTEGADQLHKLNKNLHQTVRSEQHTLKAQ